MEVAGDLDGDSVADVLVGDPFYADGAGRVAAYSGMDGTELFDFSGVVSSRGFGLDVAVGADYDKDGVLDWFGTDRNGQLWLISGGSGRLLWASADHSLLRGFDVRNVSSVGDIDGDGVIDFVLGVRRAAQAGCAYLLSGYQFEVMRLMCGHGGADSFGALAWAIADQNLDGIPDLVLASRPQLLDDSVGKAYGCIVSGRTGVLLADLDEYSAGAAHYDVVRGFKGVELVCARSAEGLALIGPKTGIIKGHIPVPVCAVELVLELDGDGSPELVCSVGDRLGVYSKAGKFIPCLEVDGCYSFDVFAFLSPEMGDLLLAVAVYCLDGERSLFLIDARDFFESR